MKEMPSPITKKLLDYLEVNNTYSRSDLLPILEFKNINAFRKGVVSKQKENFLLLFVTEHKHSDIPNYSDKMNENILEWEGPEKHSYESKIISGNYYLLLMYRNKNRERFAYKGMLELVRYQPELDVPSKFVFNLIENEKTISKSFSSMPLSSSLTHRDALSKIRVGQSGFRGRALELWGYKCSVTSVSFCGMLIASHIKPWRESNDFERLDEKNCLMLIPNLDRLFDAGLITFSPTTGKVILSERVDPGLWKNVGVDESFHLRFIPDRTEDYLRYHNRYIFNYIESEDKICDLIN